VTTCKVVAATSPAEPAIEARRHSGPGPSRSYAQLAMAPPAYLSCINCNAPRQARVSDHSFTCSNCHKHYEAIRCGMCHGAYLTDKPAWSTSRCALCGHVEKSRYSAEATLEEIKDLAVSRNPLESERPPGAKSPSLAARLAERDGQLGRVGRRSWPIGVALVYVAMGLLYCFRWDSVVLHIPSCWVWPNDLWGSYRASSNLAHGHLGSIYTFGFLEFPGILVALAPFGALSGVLHSSFLQIATASRLAPAYPQSFVGPGLVASPVYHSSAGYFVVHPQWLILVAPYALILSSTALFAFDALAERFGISRPRRAVLCIAEAVLLWNMTVRWGHPEDAVAVALATYALIFALDGRFVGAGWLLGAALVFQPLVLLMIPPLLAFAGRKNALGMAVRSVLPAGVLIAAPLIANFRATVHALVDQPSSPSLNHATPWTALSPSAGGGLVAAGPIRIFGLVVAIGVGIWIYRRSVTRPEVIVWSCALGLALRPYTESVMTAYYPWAALAVGLVVAAKYGRRLSIAVVVAIATTVLAEQHLGWLPWWTIQMAGVSVLLLVAVPPRPLALAAGMVETRTASTATGPPPPSQHQSGSGGTKRRGSSPAASK
jgi:hypothetical protein